MRRRQEDRRAATRTALLEATLRCLGEKGYAGASIGEVVKMSGLSRGAVDHHFNNKLDLVAEAVAYFYEQRFERLERRLITEGGESLNLSERLRIFREDVDAWAPVGFEIMVATRTDPDLETAYEARINGRRAEMVAAWERMFPEFAALASPERMIGVVGAFLRGLSLESRGRPTARADALFELFVAMVETAVEQKISSVIDSNS
ncbi:TetR/AcrR family transcriptional regulator [Brevundimonas sp. SORGH_AS_0993]|uniref:TetR/AcrR family transcriptional regulator n=1 Tax=Brevundimonas sp. SORGH_AS_0993 TaxID=3041794 RepID=UPI0027839040|nr:TetR/AcrR family transcriptional regulator [Brevundimonas sp. SORGH_AS_0993]MDQ1154622.1 AcrR family transcriptional regulator [Brevundimonas sp. SORGH_AS_0993]